MLKNGTPYPLCEGTLFCVLRDERFSIDGDGELQYCYVTFSGRRAEELVERAGLEDQALPGHATQSLSSFWLEALHSATQENIDLVAESVLLYSLAQLHFNTTPQSDLVTKMLMLTNDRFTEADFSLSLLAAELGYDAKYLSALFKKKKGIAFTQHLRDLRVRHALFLMEQGVVSVKNIAILSGFLDALYFSKIFKQCMGMSPKSYIEQLQNA
jgi:YesN/AraC family two-component response regulator